MENNNRSSRCRKIRQALANSCALRAIHRISHYDHQESSRASNSPLAKPVKVSNGEAHGSIPIKFDYSSPSSSYIGHAQVGKVATKVEPEPPHYVSRSNATSAALIKGGGDEDKGKMKAHQDYFDQQYEKKDMNYMFGEYIQRARERIRTVSNIGKGQNKPALNEAYNNNNVKKDNHRDQISDFIQRTKKKIRTTSTVASSAYFVFIGFIPLDFRLCLIELLFEIGRTELELKLKMILWNVNPYPYIDNEKDPLKVIYMVKKIAHRMSLTSTTTNRTRQSIFIFFRSNVLYSTESRSWKHAEAS
ncbi:protein bunched, class 2/F/G isoform [Senna tora]|uniref:Protein bunched, class 2/F/G isoform n=1 Tax=Senna tora TaxID=362788 RepID=A0A834SJM7_9FABA|nr:protein bunched, class 2/F/G isoform [Senna tora]